MWLFSRGGKNKDKVVTRTFQTSRETQVQYSSLSLINHTHFQFLTNHIIVVGHHLSKKVLARWCVKSRALEERINFSVPEEYVPVFIRHCSLCYLWGQGGAHIYKASQCWAFVRKRNSPSFGRTLIVVLQLMVSKCCLQMSLEPRALNKHNLLHLRFHTDEYIFVKLLLTLCPL